MLKLKVAWMGACRECRRLFYVRYFRTESSKSCGTTFYIEFRRIACVSKRWRKPAMGISVSDYIAKKK